MTRTRSLAPPRGQLLPGAGSVSLVSTFFGATHDLPQLSHKLHGHDGSPEFPPGVVRSHGLLEMAQVLIPHLGAPLGHPRMLQQLGERGAGAAGVIAQFNFEVNALKSRRVCLGGTLPAGSV